MFKKYYIILSILLTLTIFRTIYFCNFDLNDCSEKKVNDSASLISGVVSAIRNTSVDNIQSYLPSPHSELLLGMVLGIDLLKELPKFSEALIKTGTIHIVVVSGYNISLVFSLVISVIGTRYKLRNFIIAQIFTLLYAFVSGFEAPVIRAWIMGGIVGWGKYYGRNLEVLRVLIFSAVVMIFINPAFLFSISFQLSFLATLSLVLYSDYFKTFFHKVFPSAQNILGDFISSMAAQILVTPLISFYFGRISVLSPLVNAFVLWTVPISTVFGFVFLALTYLAPTIAPYFSWFIYVPLDIFVRVINYCSSITFVSLNYKLSLPLLLTYYLFVFTWALKR